MLTLGVLELGGLEVLHSRLYDDGNVQTARISLGVHTELSTQDLSHKLVALQPEGSGELPQTQPSLGQHLPNIGDQELHVGVGVGLARHGAHLDRHVALQRLEAVERLAVVDRKMRRLRAQLRLRLGLNNVSQLLLTVVIVEGPFFI